MDTTTENYDSFCECDYSGCVGFYRTVMRTARKRHRCTECRGWIEPGERYEYASGKQDDIWTAKTCARCLALVEWIKAHVPCYCRMHGDLYEERLQSMIDDARHTPGFAFGILRRVAAVKRHNEQRRNDEPMSLPEAGRGSVRQNKC